MTHTIVAYNLLGGWFFDDARHGLVAEALIEGADTAIDKVLADAGSTARHVRIRFSDTGAAGLRLFAVRVGRSNGGTDYEFESDSYPLAGHRMWLCPALEKYYPEPPRALHLDFTPLEPEEAEVVRELVSRQSAGDAEKARRP